MCAYDHEVLIGHFNAALERHVMGSQSSGTSLGAGFAVQHLQSGGKLSSLTKSVCFSHACHIHVMLT